MSAAAALANVKLIAQQLEKQYPDSNRGYGGTLATMTQALVGDIRPILFLLLGGAGLLLVIASVNVASLLLVRSESRKPEIAVRSALGAGRARLIGQFVTEALVLVGAGSVLGLSSAYWVTQLLTGLISADMLASVPFLHGLSLNARVLAFAGAISLFAALLFSITPSLHLSAGGGAGGLDRGQPRFCGTTWRRLGSKLVVLELAIAMVLLPDAGLLGKSLYLLLHVSIGLQPDHLATLFVAAPHSTYAKDPQVLALERQIVSRIASLTGVKSVGISSDLPVGGWGDTTWFRVLGRPWHGEHNDTPERDVSAGYLATLGAKLLRGRYFTEEEDASKPRVAIINQALAKQYFPGEDAIGKQISGLSVPPVPIEIVGIVEDIKEGELDTANRSVLYFPFNQSPGNNFNLIVRTSQAERSLLPALAAIVHGIDPGIVTTDAVTMRERINDSPSAWLHRSSAWLVGGFAALALLLSVVGLYGVIAYCRSQRTREIGIRMALGAEHSSVYQLILKEAGWLAVLGIVIGLAGAVAAATLIRGLLFGVHSWDVPTLAAVAAVLGLSALLASFIPARRAASVNPIEALRTE